jgi:hypothetical protein
MPGRGMQNKFESADKFIQNVVLQQNQCSPQDFPVFDINGHKIFYVNNNVRNVTQCNPNDLKSCSVMLIDYSREHGDTNDGFDHDIRSWLEQHQLNYYIMSWDPADHFKHSKMIYFPRWYHHTVNYNGWFDIASSTRSIDSQRQYAVSCLNKTNRFHRIYNYFMLKNKFYFDKILFTMYPGNSNFIEHCKDFKFMTVEQQSYHQAVLTNWGAEKNKFQHWSEFTNQQLVESANNAYFNSYINLVTETTMVPKTFITEKTWKAVAAGQFFLIIGGIGTVNYLRQQGVDTFDDIIDHKYYDQESDWTQRIHKIHEVVEDLLTQDLQQLYYCTVSRRQANVDNFFAGKFDTVYKSQLIECINTPN